MVSSSVKAQVSLKLMQLGLEGGAIRGTNIPVPVIIAPNISGIDIKPDLDIESFQRADTFEPSGTEDCDFQESLETGIQSALSNSRPKID
jgi:hypothetical protein